MQYDIDKSTKDELAQLTKEEQEQDILKKLRLYSSKVTRYRFFFTLDIVYEVTQLLFSFSIRETSMRYIAHQHSSRYIIQTCSPQLTQRHQGYKTHYIPRFEHDAKLIENGELANLHSHGYGTISYPSKIIFK